MKAHWLNKKNNSKLIVFMAGWSFDYYPFVANNPTDYDVLFVYNYNEMSIPTEFDELDNYEERTLIAWSMGVFVAYKFRGLFFNFDNKIALNGTIFPVDNKYGIPVKAFELTLRLAEKSLAGRFYQNLFLTDEEYELYKSYPVRRTLDDRVSELVNLYECIKNADLKSEKFYDKAIVSEFDKIIPPENQLASHKKCLTDVVKVPYGHYPYYNFASWEEIIQCK